MTITSKDLGGGNALTGVARKEQEDKLRKEQEMNEKLLAAAILKVKEEQSKQLTDIKKSTTMNYKKLLWRQKNYNRYQNNFYGKYRD